MVAFIDEHRDVYGVGAMCSALRIAPSTYYLHRARVEDPDQRSNRAKRDEDLRPKIERVWNDNHAVYGAEKVWRQLGREQVKVARYRRAADARPGAAWRRPRTGLQGHDRRRRGGRPAT